MNQSRKRKKNLINTDDFRYAGRQYKDYAIAQEILKDLKVMVHAVLGFKQNLEIQSSETPTNFGVVGRDEKYKWFGYIKPGGYIFLSKSEIGLYCEIIETIVGDQLYIPFSY